MENIKETVDSLIEEAEGIHEDGAEILEKRKNVLYRSPVGEDLHSLVQVCVRTFEATGPDYFVDLWGKLENIGEGTAAKNLRARYHRFMAAYSRARKTNVGTGESLEALTELSNARDVLFEMEAQANERIANAISKEDNHGLQDYVI